MRILNVTETYAPFLEFGGPPVKVRALSEGLAQSGNSANVLTADWGLEARFPESVQKAGADRSPFGWRLKENGVQTIYLPTWLRYRALTWNPAVRRYCRARLRDFDIVHIFGLYDLLGPTVASYCRHSRLRLPYVVEPIGMFVPIVRSLPLKRIYHSFWGRKMLSGAAAIIATSEQEVEELVSGGITREKIQLRRNGVNLPSAWPVRGTFRRQQNIPPDARVVLFLGRLSSKKSPDLLLEAFSKLPPQLDGHPLWLVFAGPDESGMKTNLEKMASRLNISSRVQIVGPIFEEARWAAYRDADIFVLPSQNENFGNTAAEAIGAGTPVIVTEQCGIAPLLEEAGIIVPHDTDAIANALLRFFTEPDLASRLSAGCPVVTSRLGWAEPVAQMESLYAKLVPK